jgi:hypothetical protein
MVEIYVDMDLASGLNDGTDWANAYQSITSALDGSASSGDNVWVRGTETTTLAITLTGGTTTGNPVRVFGVKAATTNEPPVTSDLIAGWRTGETRTEANLAYNDGALPKFENTHTSNDISLNGQFYFYGIHLKSGDNIQQISNATLPGYFVFEECKISCDQFAPGSNGGGGGWMKLKNCHTEQLISGIGFVFGWDTGQVFITGGKFTNSVGATTSIVGPEVNNVELTGVDLSDLAHTIMDISSTIGTPSLLLRNCQLHASTAILSGTRSLQNFRVELYGCANITGKSSGTIQNFDISTEAGDITEETTFVRAGGANDGGTGAYSLSFTPVINGTRDQYHGLIGPWMYFEVTAGVTKTVDVYIANSGAGDYNDDDVWLEVIYPSEDGIAQYSNETTQMNLLGTPSAIADDTLSDWSTGAGGKNAQKLTATINPDYIGIAYCRVVFAKNFSSSPETLYVDPQPVYT